MIKVGMKVRVRFAAPENWSPAAVARLTGLSGSVEHVKPAYTSDGVDRVRVRFEAPVEKDGGEWRWFSADDLEVVR